MATVAWPFFDTTLCEFVFYLSVICYCKVQELDFKEQAEIMFSWQRGVDV